MKKVVVIVLHFNNDEDTTACLHSLQRVKSPKNYVITLLVVDNGSKNPYIIKAEKEEYDVVLLRNEENKGYAGGMNTGLEYAQKNNFFYSIVLNNDTEVDDNFITHLIHTAEEHPDAGIVAPKIYFAKGSEYHKERYGSNDLGRVIWYAGGFMDWKNVIGFHRGVDEVDRGQYNKTEKTDFGSGCCLLLTQTMLKKIGMFDARYFLYYEDSDLNMRAKAEGFAIYFEPKAMIYHKNAGSAGGSGSSLQDYFITRNRLMFGMRYAPVRARLALFRESLRLLFTGRVSQKKGVQDFFFRKFGKGSY